MKKLILIIIISISTLAYFFIDKSESKFDLRDLEKLEVVDEVDKIANHKEVYSYRHCHYCGVGVYLMDSNSVSRCSWCAVEENVKP